MSAAFLRKYNTAITAGTAQSIGIPLIKRGVVDFAVGADWTPVAGDVKVSKDGGAAANIATLPAAVAMGNGAYWEFVFSNTELACGSLRVCISDSATKAVEDQFFIIETFGNASALYQWDMSLANLPANVTQLLGTAWLTPGVAGTPDVTLTAAERNSTADALLDRSGAIEVGLTLRQALRLAAAAAAGKLSGAAGASIVIRNAVADSKARITATVDTSGNRTAVTTDVT